MGPTIADQSFRPRSIEQHAAAKLTQRPHILVAWRNFCRAALLHFAAVCHVGIVWTYLNDQKIDFQVFAASDRKFDGEFNEIILKS